jgi:signal transduction histidine kinase
MSASATPTPGRYAPVAVLTVTLVVFAVAVAYVSLWLRSGLREQILQREAAALTEVASMQLANEADSLAALGVNDASGELLNAVLKTSRLRGVFAVRIFDADRKFATALPLPWSEAAPPAEDWEQLRAGQPIARLHDRQSAAEIIGVAPSSPAGRHAEPVVETWLPLRRADGAPFAGAAQMWIDGHAVAREFEQLDRRLLTQALLAWVAGGALISVLLVWSFRRLAEANRQLQIRSEDLLRANRELTLAAKSSALGAVTAHLMHELKNPVAGLEEFVASQSEGSTASNNGGELAAATELTRRLRTMINDVVAVMHDEQGAIQFELSPAEILELVTAKAAPIARQKRIAFATGAEGIGGVLDGRRANLVTMVLYNLVQNAIDASAPDTTITLSVEDDGAAFRFSVSDCGPGLAPAIRERLFQPVSSAKRGGSGLGLALSQQLARQAGGRIDLIHTGPNGTCFQLVVGHRAET